MKLFCNLSKDADKIVEHKLGEHPLVDVYQLGYFLVACATGEEESQVRAEWALFYLYHADERRLRVDKTQIDIETTPKYRMLWKPLLDQLKEEKRLDFNDDTTLDDLETDFWRAMFAAPNDEFDPDAYCHSPWFEKCCGEKRTVGDLTKHGDFDDIYLKIKPGKTIDIQPDAQGNPKVLHEPTNVRVSHLDADTILLRDLGIWSGKGVVFTGDVDPPANYGNYMPVMVLLKA
jgi:hypothetical protein